MRIAMIGPFGLRPNKTMGSRALGLARSLIQRGREVAIFMPPWQTPEEADRWWEEDGVILRYSTLGEQPFSTSRNLLDDVLAWKPDIVHGFKPKAYSGLALWWLWQFHRRNLRLVVDMDDWEGPGGWNDLAPYSVVQKRFFSWQEKWGMAHAHALTVASRTLEGIVWSNGIAAERVHYLPNGSGLNFDTAVVTEEQIKEKRSELGLGSRPTLLIYSRFFEFDTRRLAEILAGVKNKIPELAVLMIGESLYAEDAQQLREHLESNQVLSSIIDLGWVAEGDLPLLLRAAGAALYLMDDTLINRSKCPVKLADLIAAGVPVVAEDVGQVSEYVVNGVTGYLRPTGDIDGLSDYAMLLLRNKKIGAAFGQAAQRHYHDNFSWDRLATRLDAVYSMEISR
jgi:glycosyltransferase involved in cell wall biosynthesis